MAEQGKSMSQDARWIGVRMGLIGAVTASVLVGHVVEAAERLSRRN